MASTTMNNIILLVVVSSKLAIMFMLLQTLGNSLYHKFIPFGIAKSKFSFNILNSFALNNNLMNSNFSSGKSYFKGPWLLTPPEVPGTANKYFYRQELILSTTQDVNPTIAIVGRCAVLEANEFISCKY